MLKPELLAMLRCPEDHTLLTQAGETLLADVNNRIRSGQLRNRGGRVIESQLDGGLTKASGDLMYPIVDGIPVLVRDEAIPLDQISGSSNSVGSGA